MKKIPERARLFPARDEQVGIKLIELRHVRGGVQNPLREQTPDVATDSGSVLAISS